jgi:hypothetical protein
MRVLFLFSLLLGSVSLFAVHPLNISSAKIVIKNNKATLNITFNYGDFNAAASQFSKTNLLLENDKFTAASVMYIVKYWNESFKMWLNGGLVKMKLNEALYSFQEDGGIVQLNFTIPHFDVLGKKLKIHNSLLLNAVSVQRNIVHIYMGEEAKLLTVQMFAKGDTEKEVSL